MPDPPDGPEVPTRIPVDQYKQLLEIIMIGGPLGEEGILAQLRGLRGEAVEDPDDPRWGPLWKRIDDYLNKAADRVTPTTPSGSLSPEGPLPAGELAEAPEVLLTTEDYQTQLEAFLGNNIDPTERLARLEALRNRRVRDRDDPEWLPLWERTAAAIERSSGELASAAPSDTSSPAQPRSAKPVDWSEAAEEDSAFGRSVARLDDLNVIADGRTRLIYLEELQGELQSENVPNPDDPRWPLLRERVAVQIERFRDAARVPSGRGARAKREARIAAAKAATD